MTTTETRVGDWMQTFTNRAFYPLDPRVEEIDPLDIAHGLSLLCRYNGHTRSFYSVAEHCVLMSEAVPVEDAAAALLHDATEAYMGDMIRPLKKSMPDYVVAETRLMAVIADRFGIGATMPASVKAADNSILVDERRALLGPTPLPWAVVEDIDPLGVVIHGWSPAEAEQRYLARLTDLGLA